TGWASSGLASDSPDLTAAWVSATASDTTVLPAVSDTISRASRMGTPARTSAASDREKRARAVLWASCPKTGARSLKASHRRRPAGVFTWRLRDHTPKPAARITSGKNFLRMLEAD